MKLGRHLDGGLSSVHTICTRVPTLSYHGQLGRRGRGDVPHDEHVRDEELDIALIKMLRKHVFPHARVLDLPLLEKLLGTIERGMACMHAYLLLPSSRHARR